MANKKQIKELVIQTTSKGTKEVVNEVVSLNEALKGAVTASDQLTNSLKGSAKYVNGISTAYNNATKSITSSLDAVRKLNSALNGDTKKANQSMSAYLDNLQLLNLELNTTSAAANKAANALGRMATVTQIDKVISLLEDLNSETAHVVVGLETLNSTMSKIETNTGKASARIKQARDNISEVGVFTNRTNEELGDLSNNFNKVGAKAADTTKQTDKFNNSLRRLNSTGSSSARAFSSLAFGMNPLVSAYAAIAVNIYALTEAFRVLKEAASLDRLSEQAANFSASMSGVNIKELSKNMQEASGYALALGDSMKQSIRGVSYGFTSDELLKLTEGARKASVALGIDFTDAMDRVIRGISKQEVELLDELGVVTRLDTAFNKYAATLGKTGDQLSDIERKTALTNEVMTQLTSKYTSFSTAANNMERLGTATKNLVDNSLIKMARALDSSALGLAKLFELFGPSSSKIDLASEDIRIFNAALASGKVDQATVALSNYQKKLKEVSTTSRSLVDNTKELFDSQQKIVDGVIIGAAAASALILVKFSTLAGIAATVSGAMAVIGSAAAALAGGLAAVSGAVLAVVTSFAFLPVVAVTAAVTALGAALYFVLDYFELLDPLIDSITAGFNAQADAIKLVGQYLYSEFVQPGIDGVRSFTSEVLGFNKSLEQTKKNYVELRREMPFNRVNTMNLKDALGSSGAGQALGGFGSPLVYREITEAELKASEANIKYMATLDASAGKVKELALELTYGKTKMQELAQAARNIVPPNGFLEGNNIAPALKLFEDLKTAGYIAKNAAFDAGRGLVQWANSVDKASNSIAEFSKSRETLESIFASGVAGSATSELQQLEYSISLNNKALAYQEGLGKNINSVERDRLRNANLVAEAKIKELESARRILLAERGLEILSAQLAANAELRGAEQSVLLEQEKDILLANKEKLIQERASTEVIDHRIKLLDIEIAKQKQLEAIEMSKARLDIALQNQQVLTAKAGTEQAKVASLEKELALKRAQIDADKTLQASEKARQLNSLSLEQASLAGMKDGAMFKDASNVMGNIAGLEGLTDLQSTFAGSMSGISDTYSKFLTDMEGKGGSFMDYLTGNIDGMSNVLSSSLSLAQAAFSQISDAKIASIDSEIEAEKRRDGKSEESLAKIKKLQAQKIKEETKAKKASVIMSTAAAVMQAFAQMGPFGAPFAAALGAIGMLQLATIDKAASGQLAGLNSGSANLSISGGNRSNEIDVSRRANAGELSYLQGANGSGSASNFMPGKAVGGYSPAGTSIVVGESGPEVITPAVPVSVTPSGQSGNPIQITLSPVFHTNTIDSSGFEQLTQKYSRELYDGLERELRARNRTLDNL